MTMAKLKSSGDKARLNRGRLVTYCPISSESFIRNQVRILAPAITKLISGHPCKVNIKSYTPPYSISDKQLFVSDFLIGFLSLDFLWSQKSDCSDEGPFLSLGVEFGQQTNDRKLFRDGIDLQKILSDPENPQSGHLIAVNFDEAWRFTCCLLSQIEVTELTIEYGL